MIRDKVSEANEAVILIRKIEAQAGELDASSKEKNTDAAQNTTG